MFINIRRFSYIMTAHWRGGVNKEQINVDEEGESGNLDVYFSAS